MTQEQIIQSYWIGLQRTKNPAKHLHNFYRDLFGQPFYKANLTGMYKVVKEFGAEVVFNSICDLCDWNGFTPTRNIIPIIYKISERRYIHKQASENQPDMVDLSDFMRELAHVK